jgi:hypothetical protein
MEAAAATAASPMAFLNSGVKAGEGASSSSFWFLLWNNKDVSFKVSI